MTLAAAVGRIALACVWFIGSNTAMAEPRTKQIRIEYALPKDPAYQSIYETLKRAGILEYVGDLLDTIRLPRRLTIKLTGCEGFSNAWHNDDTIAVCYELADEIIKNAAKEDLPVGISRQDTIVGPLIDVLLHESGHAVFEYLHVPIFGRAEDAADQFSAYIMAQYGKERARRLLFGAAYQYKAEIAKSQVTLPLTKFSDVHGLPAQRFFNVLCVAYGSDPEFFSDTITRGYLPKDRAESCRDEYREVRFAFRTLIGPHIDKPAAARALKMHRPRMDEHGKVRSASGRRELNRR